MDPSRTGGGDKRVIYISIYALSFYFLRRLSSPPSLGHKTRLYSLMSSSRGPSRQLNFIYTTASDGATKSLHSFFPKIRRLQGMETKPQSSLTNWCCAMVRAEITTRHERHQVWFRTCVRALVCSSTSPTNPALTEPHCRTIIHSPSIIHSHRPKKW